MPDNVLFLFYARDRFVLDPASVRVRQRKADHRGQAFHESRQMTTSDPRKAYKSRQMPTKAYTVKNVGFCRLLWAFVGFGAAPSRADRLQSPVGPVAATAASRCPAR
jgi:hypothetical protein